MTFAALVSEAARLLARHGGWAYAEFLALAVGSTTLHMLVSPDAFLPAARGGNPPGVMAVLADPVVLASEAAFAIVFGLACLRIWWHEGAGPPPPEDRRAILGRAAVPLVVLNILTGYAAYLGLLAMLVPGFVIAALTTTLTPAIVIEERGWGGLGRAVAQVREHLWLLCGAWAALLLPWILVTVSLAGLPEAANGPGLGLWLAYIVPDAIGAGLSTASLCLTMAAYRLIEGTASPGR